MEKTQSPANNKKANNRGVLIVVISILLIFTLVVGLSLNIIGSNMIEEADIRYQTITNNVSDEITTWFTNEAQIVLSQKAAIEIMDKYNPDDLTAYLTEIVNNYNEDGYIYDLYFVNTDNVMSSGYGYIPDPSIDFRTRDWYQDTLTNDGLYYSVPYKDSNLDKYVVTISTTCYDSNGNLKGVLALDIFVDTLFAIAEDKALDGDSYVFLVDSEMGIATHPNEDYGYVNDAPLPVSDVDNNVYKFVAKAIETGKFNYSVMETTNSLTDYDGVLRTIYISQIPCCNWYVVSAIESSVFMKPLYITFGLVVAALIVCLAVGIAVTKFATNFVIDRLNEANEEAKEANKAKGIFLANMSHEIRTPINAIIGMNEMVIRENTDPKINDYALDIASASRSLVTIVNDILDFSKIDSGKMEIVEAEFNIASVINDIINMSESRLGNKELELIFKIDPNIPVGIVGDEMRIKQIILNLMTNGIKYTNTGFVTMRAEFTKHDYGINLNVFVRDSGIGISEENLNQLYQSFKRFDSKRNRSIEGTGLGLSITKRLITAMGGFINVTSTIGNGSEFSFSIPLKVSNDKPFIEVENRDKIKGVCLIDTSFADIRTRKEISGLLKNIKQGLKLEFNRVSDFEQLKIFASEEAVTHVMIDKTSYFENEEYFKELSKKKNVVVLQKRGDAVEMPSTIMTFYTPLSALSVAALLNNKKHAEIAGRSELLSFKAPEAKILIVDDNAMNLKVASGLMKPYNMKITTVDSGMKAIDTLKADPTYDIVFMDHMMPVMDGIETTAKIREMDDEYFKKVPIIALTANTINNAKRMFLEAGFDSFLAKPISISLLDKELREYLPDSKIVISGKANTEEKKEEVSEPKPTELPVFSAEEGLKYMGGDESLYLDVLTEYVQNYDEMRNFIKTSFEAKDWPNYVIKVHALKSTSLTIGAAPLSALAKELELSGKAGNIDPIMEKTEKLLADYEEVHEKTGQYLKDKGIQVEKPSEEEPQEDVDMSIASGLADEFKSAIDDFDSDKAEEIYEKAKSEGKAYEQFFQKTIKLIRDFEYDAAAEEIERKIK